MPMSANFTPSVVLPSPPIDPHRKRISRYRLRLLAMDSTLIAAIIGFVGAISVPMIGWWISNRQARQTKRHLLGLEELEKQLGILYDFANLGADAGAILMVGHNGGGQPSASTPYWASTLRSAVPPVYDEFARSYRESLVNAEGLRLIMEMIQAPDQCRSVETANLPADSTLRLKFDAQGLSCVLMIGLGVLRNNYHFVAVRRTKGVFSPVEIQRARTKATLLWATIGGKGSTG